MLVELIQFYGMVAFEDDFNSEKLTGEDNGNPFQYSCLENPMEGGAWEAVVHGVAKSRTRLSNFTSLNSDSKESTCNAGDLGPTPESGRFPWRRKWQPSPVFLPGESHGQRSLMGYSPWGLLRMGHD